MSHGRSVVVRITCSIRPCQHAPVSMPPSACLWACHAKVGAVLVTPTCFLLAVPFSLPTPVSSQPPGFAAASCAATTPKPSAAAARTALSASCSARPSRPSSLGSIGGASMARHPVGQHACWVQRATRRRLCTRANVVVLAVVAPAAWMSVERLVASISCKAGCQRACDEGSVRRRTTCTGQPVSALAPLEEGHLTHPDQPLQLLISGMLSLLGLEALQRRIHPVLHGIPLQWGHVQAVAGRQAGGRRSLHLGRWVGNNPTNRLGGLGGRFARLLLEVTPRWTWQISRRAQALKVLPLGAHQPSRRRLSGTPLM